MNCHEVEPVLSDLARGQMMDASQRESALAHSQLCAACAARLENERAIEGGLKVLAASYASEEAPARVEDSVIAAFRNQSVASPVRRSAIARRWLYIAASVAAAAVIVALLSMTGSRSRNSKPLAPESAKGGDVPAAREAPKQAPRSPDTSAGVESRNDRITYAGKVPSKQKRRQPVPTAEVEIATDFFPLIHGENLTQLEAGHVVRVALPRSALMSFGLPMNMDRANEPIKADVVFGDDGLARAIRFVR